MYHGFSEPKLTHFMNFLESLRNPVLIREWKLRAETPVGNSLMPLKK